MSAIEGSIFGFDDAWLAVLPGLGWETRWTDHEWRGKSLLWQSRQTTLTAAQSSQFYYHYYYTWSDTDITVSSSELFVYRGSAVFCWKTSTPQNTSDARCLSFSYTSSASAKITSPTLYIPFTSPTHYTHLHQVQLSKLFWTTKAYKTTSISHTTHYKSKWSS